MAVACHAQHASVEQARITAAVVELDAAVVEAQSGKIVGGVRIVAGVPLGREAQAGDGVPIRQRLNLERPWQRNRHPGIGPDERIANLLDLCRRYRGQRQELSDHSARQPAFDRPTFPGCAVEIPGVRQQQPFAFGVGRYVEPLHGGLVAQPFESDRTRRAQPQRRQSRIEAGKVTAPGGEQRLKQPIGSGTIQEQGARVVARHTVQGAQQLQVHRLQKSGRHPARCLAGLEALAKRVTVLVAGAGDVGLDRNASVFVEAQDVQQYLRWWACVWRRLVWRVAVGVNLHPS